MKNVPFARRFVHVVLRGQSNAQTEHFASNLLLINFHKSVHIQPEIWSALYPLLHLFTLDLVGTHIYPFEPHKYLFRVAAE